MLDEEEEEGEEEEVVEEGGDEDEAPADMRLMCRRPVRTLLSWGMVFMRRDRLSQASSSAPPPPSPPLLPRTPGKEGPPQRTGGGSKTSLPIEKDGLRAWSLG